MRDFQNLQIWQKAHALAVATNQALGTSSLSTSARGQLQRAVASIPANIAEGCGRRTDVEFARFLDIALGSLKETENHLLFARDIGALRTEAFEQLNSQVTEVRKMLFAFTRAVRLRIGQRG